MSKRRVIATGVGVLALAGALILPFESDRETGYRDVVGVATAGAGHTGADVEVGQRYDLDRRQAWFDDDRREALATVDRCTPGLPEKARAAFTSFTFNVGGRAYCASTLARKANAGDLRGACAELSRWTYAGGRELPGLVRRRAAERKLCEESLTAAVGKFAYSRLKPAPNLASTSPPKKSAIERPAYVLARPSAVPNRDRSYRPARGAEPVRSGRLVDSRPRRASGRR
ncbi:lysozyme [Chitinimonas lacunae]|uniref:Lysozyme n=1 Tax=Chitinimonas lacunae TaxID=1963018 RepID=A0ABV8MN68_9NEIS